MGISSSVGITLPAVLSLSLGPAVLALLRLPTRQAEAFSPRLSAALRRLVQGEMRHRRAVLAGGILLALLWAWQIPSIQVGSDFLSVFREDHPMRQAADGLSRHLAGSLG